MGKNKSMFIWKCDLRSVLKKKKTKTVWQDAKDSVLGILRSGF